MHAYGRSNLEVRRKLRQLVRQLSVWGLAREIDGYLKALPIEEFEAKMLKTYKYVMNRTNP